MRRLFAFIAAIIGGIATFISLRWLTRSREDTKWEEAQRPGKVMAVDGVALHYVEAGSGPPIVMVHGFGGQTFSFRYQMSEFARDHRCVAIDLKGFGYSERPEGGDYSLVEQARLVLRAMDVLGIERAVLMGHSMGGEVVVRMAEQAPARVEKLVLVATAPGYPLWLGPRLPFMKWLMPAFGKLARWRVRQRLFFEPERPEWDEVLAEYERPGRIYGSLNTVWEMWEDVRRQPKIDHSRIAMPVLILWGERDRVLAFPGRLLGWLRKRLPAAEVVTVPRSGHMVLEEQPEAANAAIRRFLGEAGASSEAAVRASRA